MSSAASAAVAAAAFSTISAALPSRTSWWLSALDASRSADSSGTKYGGPATVQSVRSTGNSPNVGASKRRPYPSLSGSLPVKTTSIRWGPGGPATRRRLPARERPPRRPRSPGPIGTARGATTALRSRRPAPDRTWPRRDSFPRCPRTGGRRPGGYVPRGSSPRIEGSPRTIRPRPGTSETAPAADRRPRAIRLVSSRTCPRRSARLALVGAGRAVASPGRSAASRFSARPRRKPTPTDRTR